MQVFSKGHRRKASWFREASSLLRFGKDDRGSITVEFVLWTPILFGFILMIADVSLAFMQQARLLDISREAARIVARHGLDEAGAEQFAVKQARMGNEGFDVSVQIDPEANTVTVTFLVDIQDLAPLGFLRTIQSDQVVIQTVNAIEPI